MGDPRTTNPEIVGVEVARSVVRGVRVLPERNEVVAVGEVPLPPQALDRDGFIDPAAVGLALDTLLVRMGVADRSQARVGMTIGPRCAGVGSGPAMADWIEAQATQLGQPLVCSGGLGVAFAPIRAVDQAVKTAFDIGADLVRLDLAPVAASRAIGEQIDDLICVGSGRGWQARMRDFEVLEAMENPRLPPEAPVTIVGRDGSPRQLERYGWIELSVDLARSGRVDIGRFATAVGAALGVLYQSPANLLDGRVVGARPAGGPGQHPAARTGREPSPLRPEQTLQLGVLDTAHQATVTGRRLERPAPGHRVAGGVSRVESPATSPVAVPRPGRQAQVVKEHRPAQAWGDDHVAEDDPINLFSPDTDEAQILGKGRFRFGTTTVVVLLVVLAVALAAAYRFV
jgi:hypothetical protein